MFAKILEGLTIMLILFGIGGLDGYMSGAVDLTTVIAIFTIAILTAFLARHEGGFRVYEKSVVDDDIDALLRAERKSRRARAERDGSNDLLLRTHNSRRLKG